MTHYEIKPYTKLRFRVTIDQAKKDGYTIKLSTNKKKKLDVFKDNVKVCSI